MFNLSISRVLQVLVQGKGLQDLFALELDDLDLVGDGVLVVVEVPLLVAEHPDFGDLLVEELSEADLRAIDLAALPSFLLLVRGIINFVADVQDLVVELLHLLLELLLARLLLAQALLNNGRHFGVHSDRFLVKLGSGTVVELVDP